MSDPGFTTTAPAPALGDSRLPIVGTVLTRDYRGRTINVTVMPEGFEYDGQVYALRNRSTVVPDLTAMTRSAVLIWLNQNTVPRGRLRENPLAGLAGVIGVSSGGREVKPR